MGHSLREGTAQYRLLYVQPDPDRGDRVCVGVLFRESPRRISVLYDQDFTKLRCVAPDVDQDLLRLYLTDFRSTVERSHDDLEIALKRYGPQVTASVDRYVASPITDRVKQLLLERFAMPKRGATALEGALVAGVQSGTALRQEVRERIASFTESVVAPLDLRVVRNARPPDVLGKAFKLIDPVAVAIRGRDSTVLVDGIDLRLASPKRSIGIANKVVHTFWQYGRIRAEDLSAGRVKRVGLVLNGAAPGNRRHAAAYADAHDYALAQFRKEADLTIDGSSAAGANELVALLATQ